MIITYAAIGVAITCIILYALDRKSRDEPIEWDVGLKLSSLGGMLSAGVAYAASAQTSILDIAKEVAPEIAVAQDMFVGSPTF